MNQRLISIQDLQIDFVSDGNVSTAVQHVSIEVSRGEVVAIVGESGSGKSVSSLSIMQLLPSPPAVYKNGAIYFTNAEGKLINLLTLNKKQLRDTRGNEIAMIFQEPMTSLNPVYTCGHQVMEAILLHQKTTKEQAKEKTLQLFEKVKLPSPSDIFHKYPHQLSGGQKQRVMIAMAMSCNPSLLICDEPTTALDVTVQKVILSLIKELQAQLDMGVVFITHDLGVVAEIADRVVVMYKGKIVEQGPAKEIYTSPKHPYTKALLQCRPALHSRGERLPVVSDFMEVTPSGDIKEKQIKTVAFKKQQVDSPEENTGVHINKPAVLQVKNVSVIFEGKKKFFGKSAPDIKAVNDVSFEVYEGETLGLVGESGCGKTTLGRTLLRLIEPSNGEIIFKGKNLLQATREEMQKVRKEIQIIFQDPYSSLNPRMTIGHAIVEPLQVHGIGNSSKERRQIAMNLLEKVNLPSNVFDRYPHEFSGGQRQRIVIARALALNPSFVICDESVSALDVSVQAQVLNLLNELKKEFGFTTIFISHDLSVVKYISDRIMVMNKGSIVEMGDAEEVYHHPKTTYTQNLIASIPKGFDLNHH